MEKNRYNDRSKHQISALLSDKSFCVMQSNRNGSKIDTFHERKAYESHMLRQVLNKQKSFARHKYGQAGVFKIMMRSLVQKL